MTNNNRSKMKKKVIPRQAQSFWNINDQNSIYSINTPKIYKKTKQKVKRIILIQPISMNTKNQSMPKVKKQTWGVPKINTKTTTKTKLNTYGKISFMNDNNSKKMKNSGFGISNNPVPRNTFSINTPSKNLGFLYGAVPKKQEIDKEPMKIFTPTPMTPSPLFKKETVHDKYLRPWGDADMDGSPNHMDCNPREVGEDGKIWDAIKGAGQKYTDVVESVSGGLKKAAYYLRSKEGRKAHEIDVGLANAQKAKRNLSKLQKEREKTNEEYKRDARKVRYIKNKIEEAEAEGKDTKQLERQRRALEKVEEESFSDLSKITAQVKTIKSKADTITQLEKKQEKVSKILETKRGKIVGSILSATTPLGAVPEISHMAKAKVVGSKKGKKGKSGRGRPSGPSGKYIVDGEPVTESEYQEIRTIENKKRKAMGYAKIPTKSYALNTIKQAVSRQENAGAIPEQEVGQAVPMREIETPIQESTQAVPQEYTYKEGEAIPEELYEEPTQQSQQPQRQMTVEEAQFQEQANDNILRAPNIMKGELNQTSGIFREDPKYNILNAPNFNQGGLRNVGQTEEAQSVTLGERPNSNPYGTEYTEIEPGTGRVILKRRPQEKWMTGESL